MSTQTDGGSSFLPEHQSITNANTTNPAGYTPSAEEKRTIKLVDNLYKKAKQHRMKYDQKWLDYYKFFRGKQWKEQRPSYRHSEVINLVFQSIQSTVPIQTDSRPKLSFVPQNPQDTDLADILNKVCENDWESKGWLYVLTEIIYEQNFYGASFGGMEVDPDGDEGQPSIVFKSKDPFYQFPDPSAYDCNTKFGPQKCKYWIEAEPVDLEILKKDYPDKAKYLKPDVVDLTSGSKTNIDKVRFKSPVDNRTLLDTNTGYDISDRNQSLKITCYISPEEYETEDDSKNEIDSVTDKPMSLPGDMNPLGVKIGQENDLTPDDPQPKKEKYKNGRKIVMASGMILFDGENPYDDAKFPVEKLINYILPREFWGISEVEQIMGINKIYNKIVSFVLDVMTIMGNPIWVVDTTAGIDADNLFNRPGLVVEKEPGTSVTREHGVDLPAYVLPLLNTLKSAFDGVGGATDITRGVEPEQITAASAITSLQEAAQTRLRLKSRNLDDFLQKIGQSYVSRVFQFYSIPRIIRVTADNNGYRYFKFHVANVLDNEGNPVMDNFGKPKKVARVRDFIQDTNSGNISESPDVQEFEISGKFDVRVSTGSSLPFAKNEKYEKAFKLFTTAPPPGGGVIDAEELLKDIDYPNYESVLNRMKQNQAAQAQQQPPPDK